MRFLPFALLLAALPLRADDTKEFLDPANWEGRADIWKIDGATIVGETKEDPKYNTFFCSKKKYADFEIKYKVMLRDGVGNSGLQVRSEQYPEDKAKPFRVKGPQVDVGAGYWGSLYGEGVGGMMEAAPKDKIAKFVKEKEFNEFHVVVKGSKYSIKVNGETMVDKEFPKLPAKDPKDAKDAPKDGIMAWQCHQGYKAMRVEIKDIEFTILK